MSNREVLLKKLVGNLELPDSAYEKAKSRYEDIGGWLGREQSTCVENEPHIFPQGSFRLGTAIKPLNANEEYDLDLACNLRTGVSASSHSQKELKDTIGYELEQYRKVRGITSPLDEKHRCWRLDYADSLSFHMDIVPCIPEDEAQRHSLTAMMESYGLSRELAVTAGELAVGITDNRVTDYNHKNADWLISNPEGYARWFEHRMMPTKSVRSVFAEAQVDQLPLYKRKTPLQRVVQLLKRHRDKMFLDNPDSKPISVIITTIAGNSYTGTERLEQALSEVILGVKCFAASGEHFLANPVNPEENFADKWSMPNYSHLRLRDNFAIWAAQVERDVDQIVNLDDMKQLSEAIDGRFSVKLSDQDISKELGVVAGVGAVSAPHVIHSEPNKPWLE
ncbi:MAG: nucleotidyltransferase [Pseudomonadota bacterium]